MRLQSVIVQRLEGDVIKSVVCMSLPARNSLWPPARRNNGLPAHTGSGRHLSPDFLATTDQSVSRHVIVVTPCTTCGPGGDHYQGDPWWGLNTHRPDRVRHLRRHVLPGKNLNLVLAQTDSIHLIVCYNMALRGRSELAN